MKHDGPVDFVPELLLAASLRRMQPTVRRERAPESDFKILVAIALGLLVVILGSLAQA